VFSQTFNSFPFLDDNIENQDVLDTFQNILDIVTNCEKLSSDFVQDGKIEHTADYLLDIQILKMSHDLMGTTADKMGNQDFSEDEYITGLTNFLTIDTGTHDFSKLSNVAISCSQSFQHSISLLGIVNLDNISLPRPEKVLKERQRAVKNDAPTKAPINVKQLSNKNKGAGKINCVRTEIQRICRERNTNEIPYFELICHPQDFMKSVDNAFQVSFLVRDGFLGLIKVRGEPHVFLYDPDPERQSHTQHLNDSDTVQCVMSLNPKLWQEKVAQFKIHQSLLNFESTKENSSRNNEEGNEIDEDLMEVEDSD
jgi:non-structural maintenance of chromosomes element 4